MGSALGPSVLSPVLFDINSNLQRIHEIYGNKIYLENLDNNVVPVEGSAKKGAIYSYFSTLANLLFKWNYLKFSLNEQKKNQYVIATVLLVMVVTAVGLGYSAGVYFIGRRVWQPQEHTANKVELVYSLVMATIACAYALFFMTIVYVKAKKSSQSHYDVDNIYADEPSIQHMLSMLQVEDWSIFNRYGSSSKKEYKVKGTNPLIGYFLHHQQKINLRYTYHPSPLHKGNPVGEASASCLRGKKVFRFIREDKNPYTLTRDSLLSPANTPCHVFGADGKAYVDPFLPEQSLIGPIDVFQQKIEKYDPKSQIKQFNAALYYLQSIMSPKNGFFTAGDRGALQKDTQQEVLEFIINLVHTHRHVVMFELKPAEAYLRHMLEKQQNKVFESVSREAFLNEVMSRAFLAIYYDAHHKTGYLLEENDMRESPFLYSSAAATDNGSFLLMKRETTAPASFHVQIMSRQEDVRFVQNEFTSTFKTNEQDRRPHVYFADLDVNNGTVLQKEEGSTRVLNQKISTPPMIGQVLIETPQDALSETVAVYSVPVSLFMDLYLPKRWESTFEVLKSYFIDMSVQKIHQTVSSPRKITSSDIDPNGRLLKESEKRLGEDLYPVAEDNMMQLLEQIPERYNQVHVYASSENQEQQARNLDYVNPEEFVLRISNMSKQHYLCLFLHHLDTLRRTSTGIETLDQMYGVDFFARQKNIMLFEVTTIVVAIAGGLGVLKQMAYHYLNFMCANIEFQDRKQKVDNERHDLDRAFEASGEEMQNQRRTLDRKDKEIQTQKMRLMAWYVLMTSTYAVVYMIAVGLLHTWKEKYKLELFQSNMEKNKNTSVIITHADFLFRRFTHKMMENGLLKLKSGFQDPGDINELYYYLQKHAYLENPQERISLQNDVDMSEEHRYLQSLLEAYAKPNTIASYAVEINTFPVLNTFAYSGIIAVVLIFILVTYLKFQPFKHLENISVWLRIKDLWKKGVQIDPVSYQFNCFDPGWEKENINSWFMLISSFGMIGLAVIFLIVLQMYLRRQRI